MKLPGNSKVSPIQGIFCTVLKIRKDQVVNSHSSYSLPIKGCTLMATPRYTEYYSAKSLENWMFLNEDCVPLNRWSRSLKVTVVVQIEHFTYFKLYFSQPEDVTDVLKCIHYCTILLFVAGIFHFQTLSLQSAADRNSKLMPVFFVQMISQDSWRLPYGSILLVFNINSKESAKGVWVRPILSYFHLS